MRGLILFLLLASGNAFSSSYPELCEDADIYGESSYFVTIPAMIGGCIGNIVGLPLGFLVGIPLGHPTEAAAIMGAIVNTGFNAVIGSPFYVLEYIPRSIITEPQSSDENEL